MRWNLSGVRATVRPRCVCILVILLAAAAGPVAAQSAIPDQVFDIGRLSLSQLSVVQPSLVYRPVDVNSGRPGGDALGMGGAYLATASGTVALGWNPAGLADLEHLSFSFDGYSRRASSSVGEHPAELTIPQLSRLDFLSYEASRKGGFVPNFVAAGTPLWISGERRLAVAFGWRHFAETAIPEQTVSELSASGQSGTFPVVFSFDRSERGSLEAFSPALAFRVGPTFSFGATVNVLDGGVRANTDQRFTVVGAPLRGTARTRYQYSGFSTEIGARYCTHGPYGWPGSWAFRVAPGYALKVRGGTFYSQAITPPGSPRIIVLGTLADYDLQVPRALGGGAAIRPTPRLLLAVDWNRQRWSQAKVEYTNHPQGLVDQPSSDSLGLPLADVSTWHFGAEYKLLRTSWGDVPVRIGFRTAPQGYLDSDPRDVQLQTDTLETDAGQVIQNWVTSTGHYHGKQPKANAYSFGVSLDTPGIRYDLGFESISYEQRKWFFETPYDSILNPSMAMVTVKQKVSKIRLSASYSF